MKCVKSEVDSKWRYCVAELQSSVLTTCSVWLESLEAFRHISKMSRAQKMWPKLFSWVFFYSVWFSGSFQSPYCHAYLILLGWDLPISLGQLLREDFLTLRVEVWLTEGCYFGHVSLGTRLWTHTHYFEPLGMWIWAAVPCRRSWLTWRVSFFLSVFVSF